MPVIIVGADTPLGRDVAEGLRSNRGEVRAFVSDEALADSLRDIGIQVATGDVSDGSHVELACTLVHTAVLIAEASSDTRERSFSSTWEQVLEAWLAAVDAAEVRRVIWVVGEEHAGWRRFDGRPGHVAVSAVGPDGWAGAVAEVIRIDDLPDG